MESDLLVRLALCLDPKSECTQGVREKALRSLGIDAGSLSPEEMAHRENRRLKLKAELIPVTESRKMPGAIPGLADKPWPAEYSVPIPWAGLSIIAEKIARGCEYCENGGRLIEPPYEVRTGISDPNIVSPQFLPNKLVPRTEIDFGPGCQVIRISLAEDRNIVRYRILIWGSLCLHVLIDLKDYFQSDFDPKIKPSEGISPEGRKLMQVPSYLRELK